MLSSGQRHRDGGREACPRQYAGGPARSQSGSETHKSSNRKRKSSPERGADRNSRGATLPTEAQWEYACRAGTDTLFWWGNELQEAQGKENLHDASYDNWYATLIHSKGFMRWLSWDDGYAQTSPVGKYQANPWGLYDMLGNATQWVRDGYAPYASEKRIDPIGPNQAKRRITRGGNWYVIPHYARSSRRSIVPAPFVSNTLGFRVMLEVK
mgnify:CR=1 FL=1